MKMKTKLVERKLIEALERISNKKVKLIEDESNKILIPRRSKEERKKNYIVAINKKIQEYIKNGSKGNLDLSNTPIEYLPDNLTKIEGYLNLNNTQIKELPSNLTVGGYLDLRGTQIKELPNNLTVNSNLYLSNTPLSKKYTKEEIKEMYPRIKGTIYY